MGLNQAKGNMYDFVTHTWNTVKGKCFHDCSYCYMKRFGPLRPARFDETELRTDLSAGEFIFVGSSNDLFSIGILDEWIKATLAYMCKFNTRYLLQSKNPERMVEYQEYFPAGAVFCTTIETNRWYPEIMGNAPRPEARAAGMACLIGKRYVTIEPIIDFDLDPMIELIKRCEPIQVNIGADSKNSGLPEPKLEKIMLLAEQLREFTTTEKKRNLKRLEANAK